MWTCASPRYQPTARTAAPTGQDVLPVRDNGLVIVAIQPAYGDAPTRRQFAESLDRSIPFSEPLWRSPLAEAELAELCALHPRGRAEFWGGTRAQSAKIRQLGSGDLVLLTGQLRVRGVGEVGAVLDNPDFAAVLWQPHPRRCSFEIVYSLRRFRRVEIPYARLQTALGTSERDHFQALRLIRDRRRGDAVRELVDHHLR
jgi:hypothetical protein